MNNRYPDWERNIKRKWKRFKLKHFYTKMWKCVYMYVRICVCIHEFRFRLALIVKANYIYMYIDSTSPSGLFNRWFFIFPLKKSVVFNFSLKKLSIDNYRLNLFLVIFFLPSSHSMQLSHPHLDVSTHIHTYLSVNFSFVSFCTTYIPN